ncbi:type I-E CRISPR-associated protein Cse2/CasB [Leptospira stimsonii]|uniref:Type I-E CRISPR-associated protein Cse2/CasB n=1 Tax=Leptospira stimsonii TaxID=2202203 RepID=A0A8B3CLM2_9LEPT|nr:type I-E CRISPR-associated protein Cse2/CasB [Leptospira stimsonii]RHX83879.1 type I-E CRISPR-associated protein Cse2/CasB [Leptospira stimsonii]
MKLFDPGSPSEEIILRWWADLQNNPGERATLRRCSDPSETVFYPASHRLLTELYKIKCDVYRPSLDKVCAIAGILSHVKTNNTIPFASQLSYKKSGSDQPLISDLRFRRILQYKSISEDDLFFQKMIRVIRHLDGNANILDLFSSLYFWGDSVKKRWAYDYYGTGTSTKSENETTDQGKNQ